MIPILFVLTMNAAAVQEAQVPCGVYDYQWSHHLVRNELPQKLAARMAARLDTAGRKALGIKSNSIPQAVQQIDVALDLLRKADLRELPPESVAHVKHGLESEGGEVVGQDRVIDRHPFRGARWGRDEGASIEVMTIIRVDLHFPVGGDRQRQRAVLSRSTVSSFGSVSGSSCPSPITFRFLDDEDRTVAITDLGSVMVENGEEPDPLFKVTPRGRIVAANPELLRKALLAYPRLSSMPPAPKVDIGNAYIVMSDQAGTIFRRHADAHGQFDFSYVPAGIVHFTATKIVGDVEYKALADIHMDGDMRDVILSMDRPAK